MPVALPPGAKRYIKGDVSPREYLFDGGEDDLRAPYPYFQLALNVLGEIGTDSQGKQSIPEIKRKMVLNGIGNVLEFCERELGTFEAANRYVNLLFQQAIREAVQKTLIRLLAEWYALDGGKIEGDKQ